MGASKAADQSTRAGQQGRVLEVELQDAAARLPELVNRVRMGEDVVLFDGELEVRLVLLPPGRRVLGQDAGLFEIPEDFDDPLPEALLLEEAKKLPPDERYALAEALWNSLESEPASLSSEWQAEVSSRIAQLERGEVKALPWSEVEATIRRSSRWG